MYHRFVRCLTVAAALAVATTIAAVAAGPPAWTQTVSTTVSERRGAAEAYDAASGQLVLFGGDNSVNTLNDTWVYDGVRWEQLRTAHAPVPRTNASMAYDTVTRTIILFGGDPHVVANGISYLGDTWSFDGRDWTELHPVHSPGTRAEAAATWDDAGARLLLFGGYTDATGPAQDTWTFDGVDWAQQSPQHLPPVRHGAMMAYASAVNGVVMFGGLGNPPAGSTSPYLADTWSWSGGDWTQVSAGTTTVALPTAATAPQGRWAGVMAPIAGGSAMLFAGYWDSGASGGATPGTRVSGPSSTLSDVWTYGAAGWTRLNATGPAGRYQAAAAWDPVLGAAVMYGGCCNGAGGFFTDTWSFADTWTWDGTTWTQLTPVSSPPGLYEPGATWDPDLGGILVAGGQGVHGSGVFNTVNHVWLFDGTTWTRQPMTTAPGERYFAPLAWDGGTHGAVLFGGLGNLGLSDDAWTLGTPPPEVIPEFPLTSFAAVAAAAMVALTVRRPRRGN